MKKITCGMKKTIVYLLIFYMFTPVFRVKVSADKNAILASETGIITVKSAVKDKTNELPSKIYKKLRDGGQTIHLADLIAR